VWDAFLGLWDLYVSTYGANNVPDMAYPLLMKFEYLDLLFDKIIEVKDEIMDGMPLLIEAISQIPITEDSSARVLGMLEALDWQVYEDVVGDIDACLSKLNEFQCIADLLKMLCSKDGFSLIENTIITINAELFEGETPYTKIVDKLAKQYNHVEKDDLLQKLTANLQPTIAIETIKIAVTVFEKLKLVEDYSDNLYDIKSTLVPIFNSNYMRHKQWALEIVPVTGYKHNTDIAAFTAYLDLLNTLFTSNQELSLRGWRNITGTVTAAALEKMFDNVFGLDFVDNADLLPEICSLLKWWEVSLLKRAQFIPDYEHFLLECLKENVSLNSVIASLQMFETISNINMLFASVIDLDDVHKKKVAQIIISQIKKNESPQQNLIELLSTDNNVLDKDVYIEVAHEIYPEAEKTFFTTLLEGIDDNSSYIFMINLLSILLVSIDKYKKGGVLNLIKHIIRKNKKAADDLIPILQNHERIFFRECSGDEPTALKYWK
jgi:hypothetical protein